MRIVMGVVCLTGLTLTSGWASAQPTYRLTDLTPVDRLQLHLSVRGGVGDQRLRTGDRDDRTRAMQGWPAFRGDSTSSQVLGSLEGPLQPWMGHQRIGAGDGLLRPGGRDPSACGRLGRHDDSGPRITRRVAGLGHSHQRRRPRGGSLRSYEQSQFPTRLLLGRHDDVGSGHAGR